MSNNAITLHKVTQGVVYIDGISQLGKVESIDMPDLDFMFEKIKALGMIGTIELPTLGVKELKGKMKFNSFYPAVMKGINPFQYKQIQVRSSVQRHNNQGKKDELPLVTILTVALKKIPLGKSEQHKSQEFETDFVCTYVKQIYDGEEMLEYDVLANILKVGGVNLLEEYRNNVM